MRAVHAFFALSILGVVICTPPSAAAKKKQKAKEKRAEPISEVAGHHHPISIRSAEGQRLFDQGMTLVYGFNHDEAIRSFQRAADLDPNAAMPLWGIAYALGPNINLDVDPEHEKKAYQATQKALKLAAHAPENERAYVEAVAQRYSDDPKADLKKLAGDFKDAMKKLSERYPDDLDAATLYAESLMNLHPWRLWTADGKPEEGTEEIVAVLESVMRRDANHIGANHYYIHAVEGSPLPERALPAAARLEKLVPNAGHLVHMPAHIYQRTGDYTAAAKANAEAARVDEAYIKATRVEGVYPIMYYTHNLHFLAASNAMAGRYTEAKNAADRAVSAVSPYIEAMPMGEFMLPTAAFVSLRFQRWPDVLKLSSPNEKTPPATRALWHYARGVAYAGMKDVAHAEEERAAMADVAKTVTDDEPWGTTNTGPGVLAVARGALDARIAAAKGDRKAAIDSWKAAVKAQDKLGYDEPPPWYYPVRESLGAALFVDGQHEAAEKAFREDLDRNPRNPRSLFGLWESLKAEKKGADAGWVRRSFQEAWKNAEVVLRMEDL